PPSTAERPAETSQLALPLPARRLKDRDIGLIVAGQGDQRLNEKDGRLTPLDRGHHRPGRRHAMHDEWLRERTKPELIAELELDLLPRGDAFAVDVGTVLALEVLDLPALPFGPAQAGVVR